MVQAYFDWTRSCRFDWLDGVDLELRSSAKLNTPLIILLSKSTASPEAGEESLIHFLFG